VAGALKVRTAVGPDVWTTIGGSVPVVELTQAAYDALGTKDPGTFYVIVDGADRTLLTGTTAPAAGTGIDGDFYINTTTWMIYGPKAAGAWPTGVVLAASTSSSGAFFKFDWSSTTTAPPATSGVRYNNAAAASVTNIYLSYTAKDSTDIKTRLLQGTAGDRLYIQARTNSAKYAIYYLSGVPTDNGTYATIPVTYSIAGTAMADADEVMVGFIEAPSSETYAGIVELATAAETLTGTDNVRAVHPAGAFATFAPKTLVINAQVGTTYTPVLADAGKLITLNNASAITFTLPLNASVAYPIGTQLNLMQIGAGAVTVASGGTTLGGTPSLIFRAQYSMVTLFKINTDFWVCVGDT
jgi:hypothetical protein